MQSMDDYASSKQILSPRLNVVLGGASYPSHNLHSDVVQHCSQSHCKQVGIIGQKLLLALEEEDGRHHTADHQSMR